MIIMPQNLDTSLIRTFVAVAESASMTAAANALNLTQGAVSQQVKRLEEVLGCQLFARDRRNLRLTADGERLFGKAKRALYVSPCTRGSTAEIALGDSDDVGNFDNSRLHELERVTGPRLDAEDHRIGGKRDVGFRLSDAHRLDQHDVVESAHQHHGGKGDLGKAAQLVARRHGAHEDAAILRICSKPRAIAQQRAAGTFRRGIDGDDRDGPANLATGREERTGERRFADTGRAGEADCLRRRRCIGGIEEFDEIGALARQMGFAKVASGPLVRSSYHARELTEDGRVE